jgi:hypothetical protein
MPVPVVASKPGEYTRVGLETEVKVPWLTYVFNSLVLMIVDTGLWCIGCLIWFRVNAERMSFWYWLTRRWAKWFTLNWPWYAVTLILCWIGPSALAYLYRLVIEQLAKSTPTYDNLDPTLGVWNPLGHRPYEMEEDEPDMDKEVVDVNVGAIGQRGRKRIRTLVDFPVDRRARSFYRAVAAGGTKFSQRGATRFLIGRAKFDSIRDALLDRRLAEWKDERHTNLGVDLSPDALRTFEVLGRH